MSRHQCMSTLIALALIGSVWSAAPSVKSTATKPPKELKKEIASQLSDKAIELRDEKGELVLEVWMRKLLPVKATEAEIKKGLGYNAIKKTAMLGVMRIHKPLGDYRGRKPKKGIYTMRFGTQPMDGDHMGTAPFASFFLLTPVAQDSGKETVDWEKLQENSTKASGTGHPSIWLLFPVTGNELKMTPRLDKKFGNHQIITVPCDVGADGKKKGVIGIGLTVFGKSDAA